MSRVLHVLEATEGGTRTHLRDLVLRLPPLGWEVDVAVSTGRDPSFADDLELFRDAGMGVNVVPMVRQPHPVADWRAYRELRGLIRNTQPDLVHAHSSKAGFLGRRAAWTEGVPSLYTPNAFRFQAPDAGWFERWLVVGLERLAARWGDGIICVSEGERQAAVAAHLDRLAPLHVIYNGIDLDPLERAAAQGGGRAAMGLDQDAWPIVLTIGRRVAQKGDRYLLDAWPAVVDTYPAAQLVIVGDGPLRGALQTQAVALGIGEAVTFLPRQGQVGRLYAAADVYVLPSLYEGCPYTLLEGMALGRPCVATAAEGSRDVLEDGRTGLVVPVADAPALASALLRILGDHELRRTLGERARFEARRRFTADRMAYETAEIYGAILRDAGCPTCGGG